MGRCGPGVIISPPSTTRAYNGSVFCQDEYVNFCEKTEELGAEHGAATLVYGEIEIKFYNSTTPIFFHGSATLVSAVRLRECDLHSFRLAQKGPARGAFFCTLRDPRSVPRARPEISAIL